MNYTESQIVEGGKLLAARFGADWFQRIDLSRHTQAAGGDCVADQLGGMDTWREYDDPNLRASIWNDSASDNLWQQHIVDLRDAAHYAASGAELSENTFSDPDEFTVTELIEQLDAAKVAERKAANAHVDAKDKVAWLTEALSARLREIAKDHSLNL